MNFDRISQMSQMVVGGQVMYKFDHIAVIYIDNRHYFNVYRRYNSPYNIMIEDYNLDLHLHQDHTLRTSLKTVLCLSNSTNMYVCCAVSFKHNGPVLTDILDMRWTEIQAQFQAVNVHLSGVFEPSSTQEDNSYTMFSAPSTPMNQTINPLTEPPPLVRYSSLTPLVIPEMLDEPIADPSDHTSMSLNYIDVKSRKSDSCHTGCYCEYSNGEYEEESEDEDDNYMLLRSGTVVNRNI
jgi:hypothetical protein